MSGECETCGNHTLECTCETKAPERIRVAQDVDGFWTCREAISCSQEYVRADLFDAMKAERDELLAALAGSISVAQRFQKARMFSTSEVSTLNAASSLIERIKGGRDAD